MKTNKGNILEKQPDHVHHPFNINYLFISTRLDSKEEFFAVNLSPDLTFNMLYCLINSTLHYSS